MLGVLLAIAAVALIVAFVWSITSEAEDDNAFGRYGLQAELNVPHSYPGSIELDSGCLFFDPSSAAVEGGVVALPEGDGQWDGETLTYDGSRYLPGEDLALSHQPVLVLFANLDGVWASMPAEGCRTASVYLLPPEAVLEELRNQD